MFTLSCEAVDEQCKVNLLALCADAFAVGFEGFELIFKDHFGVVKQAANEGAFAIVYAAAGDEAQEPFVLVAVQIGVYVLADEVADV